MGLQDTLKNDTNQVVLDRMAAVAALISGANESDLRLIEGEINRIRPLAAKLGIPMRDSENQIRAAEGLDLL